MAVAHDHDRYLPRDDNPAFDPKMFYTLHHANRPSYALSAGNDGEVRGTIDISVQNSTSSQNWQFFHQGGHYFIRNYDYGPGFQLGFPESEDTQSLPLLYRRRGGKGHQWTLSPVDGGWEMSNELIGTSKRYILVPGIRLPYMLAGAHTSYTAWTITANTRQATTPASLPASSRKLTRSSAAEAQPLEGDWLKKVEDDQSSSTVSINTLAATSPPEASPSDLSPSPAPRLSTGSIAGIVVGAVIFIFAVLFALWFFLNRGRKKRRSHRIFDSSCEVNAKDAVVEKDGDQRLELAMPISEISCRDGDPLRYRNELDSKAICAELVAEVVVLEVTSRSNSEEGDAGAPPRDR